jgi:hypothetical protein
MNKKILRPAIAMIELIFALVIIGIVLMSAPQLISTATKSGYVAIQQEAINEAASQVNMIMGYQWDENSADERYIPPILKVSSTGDSELDKDGNTTRRSGTPLESYRSFTRSDGAKLNATLLAALGNDTNETQDEEFDDIDDFTGSDVNLTLVEASLADNIETTTININRTIAYSSDTLASGNYKQSSIITYKHPFTSTGGTTNIKSITVTLTSSSGLEELDKKIILRAFSCNIGGYKLEERDTN